MKVLKKGRQQRGWAIEATCSGKGNGNGGCGALLLVEEGDLYCTYNHVRDERTIFVTFRCPECSVETDMDEVPSAVRKRVRKRGGRPVVDDLRPE